MQYTTHLQTHRTRTSPDNCKNILLNICKHKASNPIQQWNHFRTRPGPSLSPRQEQKRGVLLLLQISFRNTILVGTRVEKILPFVPAERLRNAEGCTNPRVPATPSVLCFRRSLLTLSNFCFRSTFLMLRLFESFAFRTFKYFFSFFAKCTNMQTENNNANFDISRILTRDAAWRACSVPTTFTSFCLTSLHLPLSLFQVFFLCALRGMHLRVSSTG